MGISIALDDFGTGEYLQMLPLKHLENRQGLCQQDR